MKKDENMIFGIKNLISIMELIKSNK